VRRNTLIGELFAEFLGTFTLVLFGVGSVAMVVLGNGLPGQGGSFFGNFTTIALGFGFAVAMGVYISGGISGGHINPAVTLALALRRGFSWGKVVPFWVAQFLGAFVAALLLRWNFSEWFNLNDPGHTYATQGVFSTSPGEGLGVWAGFRSEVIGTAALVMLILALSDARNIAPLANLAPLIIGFVVLVIGIALGGLSGFAINPARDFGPRLAEYITGFGTAWRAASGTHPVYWWVPIVAPLVGGVIGAYVYDWFIGRFVPVAEPEVGRVPDVERPPGSDIPGREPPPV
jgi:glycerol uptake facilitator protein